MPTNPPTTIQLQTENAVALITLNRPPVNALSLMLLNELETALRDLDADETVRVVIITGAGERVFSAGADFTEFASDKVREFAQKGQEVFNRIERSRKPIIAAINGSAYGGGFELALSCHLRFMADTAQLASTEVKLGIMPGWGATQRLPRLIGRTRALEYLLTGERINAQDAMICGLVNRVEKQHDLLNATKEFAARLAKGAPLAMAGILAAVTHGLETTLDAGLAIEMEQTLAVGQTEDAMIGVLSMMQKQEPQFKGR